MSRFNGQKKMKNISVARINETVHFCAFRHRLVLSHSPPSSERIKKVRKKETLLLCTLLIKSDENEKKGKTHNNRMPERRQQEIAVAKIYL